MHWGGVDFLRIKHKSNIEVFLDVAPCRLVRDSDVLEVSSASVFNSNQPQKVLLALPDPEIH